MKIRMVEFRNDQGTYRLLVGDNVYVSNYDEIECIKYNKDEHRICKLNINRIKYNENHYKNLIPILRTLLIEEELSKL